MICVAITSRAGKAPGASEGVQYTLKMGRSRCFVFDRKIEVAKFSNVKTKALRYAFLFICIFWSRSALGAFGRRRCRKCSVFWRKGKILDGKMLAKRQKLYQKDSFLLKIYIIECLVPHLSQVNVVYVLVISKYCFKRFLLQRYGFVPIYIYIIM